jgi:hypothetical protein
MWYIEKNQKMQNTVIVYKEKKATKFPTNSEVNTEKLISSFSGLRGKWDQELLAYHITNKTTSSGKK